MAKKIQALFLLVGLALALSGCALDDAWPVHSVYRPADGQAARIDVAYLTDRARDPVAPGGFGSRWAGTPSCGTATVDIPAAPQGGMAWGHIEDAQPAPCARRQTEPQSAPQVPVSALAGAVAPVVAAAARGGCHTVLLFVHGFHTGFDNAVLRAGQIAADTQSRCAVAAFSWTSSVKLDRYGIDVERSFYAQPLLGAYIRALADAGLTVNIVGHSIGARMALATLASWGNARDRPARPPVGELILAAPDIGAETDDDDFAHLVAAAAPFARRITVYASRQDAALAASQGLHDDVPRLGRRAADAGYGVTGVDIIDASALPADVTGHNYYAMSYEVIRDMARVLAGATLKARLQDAGATLQPPPTAADTRPRPAGARQPRLITQILVHLAPLLP